MIIAMMFNMVLVSNYLSIQCECKHSIKDGLWLGAILWIGFSLPLVMYSCVFADIASNCIT